MYLPILLVSSILIGMIALASAAVIFLTLYVREWNQRIKEESQYREEREKTLRDYEHRQVQVEKAVESNHEMMEMVIQKHPLITPEIKDDILAAYKQNRTRTKLPFEKPEIKTS